MSPRSRRRRMPTAMAESEDPLRVRHMGIRPSRRTGRTAAERPAAQRAIAGHVAELTPGATGGSLRGVGFGRPGRCRQSQQPDRSPSRRGGASPRWPVRWLRRAGCRRLVRLWRLRGSQPQAAVQSGHAPKGADGEAGVDPRRHGGPVAAESQRLGHSAAPCRLG